jgi:antitoxin YefM
MEAISYTETRENLKSVMDKVIADRAPVVITRKRGQGNVVMISAEEWASMEETNYLLASPRNAERLREAIRGFESGNGEEHELVHP